MHNDRTAIGVIVFLAGCSSNGPALDVAARETSGPVDGARDASTCSPGFQSVSLKACNGKAPGTEDCHFRILVDAPSCSAPSRCGRMVVFWSGGEGGCITCRYDSLLKHYAAAGFVAACAQPYTTSTETGRYPYFVEFDRMSEIMSAIRARPEIQASWDGSKLLISGVSHGGTAPLMSIASRAALRSHAAIWAGTARTAIVLYDGVGSTAALDEWAAAQPGCAPYHQRTVERYGDGRPESHDCKNQLCYCASPKHKADWDKDNIIFSSPASPYSCAAVTPASGSILYRFVSCSGEGQPACGAQGDVIPDIQQKAPYAVIKDCPGVTASYERYPACPHATCGSASCGASDSIAWLKAQGW
jgi:hypothetical protein